MKTKQQRGNEMQAKWPGHQQGCSENGRDTKRKSIGFMKDGRKNNEKLLNLLIKLVR